MYKKVLILFVILLLTVSVAVAVNAVSNQQFKSNNTANIMNDPSLTDEQKAEKIQQDVIRKMEAMINDPTIPEFVKVELKKSLEDAKNKETKQEVKEQKIVNADTFTIIKPNGKSYRGRIIGGQYYYFVPRNTVNIEGAEVNSASRTCSYSHYKELQAAKHACGGPNSELVNLDELKSICEIDNDHLIFRDENRIAIPSAGVYMTYSYDGRMHIAATCFNQNITNMATPRVLRSTAIPAGSMNSTMNMSPCNGKLTHNLLCKLNSVTKIEYDNDGRIIIRTEIEKVPF